MYLWIESGLSTLEMIIHSLRTPGYAQCIITTFLRHCKHVSGMPQPLLHYPSVRSPHLEGYLYTRFRAFVAKYDLSLQVAGIHVSPPPQDNDWCIMEVACSDPTIKDNDIKKIYFCKSYLQVKWISNLCTSDGSNVLISVKNGIWSIRQSSSWYKEVVQERRVSYTLTIWRTFLRKHICTSRWKTTVQLGDWRVSANDSDWLWPF